MSVSPPFNDERPREVQLTQYRDCLNEPEVHHALHERPSERAVRKGEQPRVKITPLNEGSCCKDGGEEDRGFSEAVLGGVEDGVEEVDEAEGVGRTSVSLGAV